jgi:hypothetical protein
MLRLAGRNVRLERLVVLVLPTMYPSANTALRSWSKGDDEPPKTSGKQKAQRDDDEQAQVKGEVRLLLL